MWYSLNDMVLLPSWIFRIICSKSILDDMIAGEISVRASLPCKAHCHVVVKLTVRDSKTWTNPNMQWNHSKSTSGSVQGLCYLWTCDHLACKWWSCDWGDCTHKKKLLARWIHIFPRVFPQRDQDSCSQWFSCCPLTSCFILKRTIAHKSLVVPGDLHLSPCVFPAALIVFPQLETFRQGFHCYCLTGIASRRYFVNFLLWVLFFFTAF